ncbi:hypothetical protein M0805_005328 [Coniferiporia weirii]|nr:hypothetical protein M0805_005328 [Coniferiporia weirii]
MPAPVVYVVVAISTVAVGFTFKEFVFDPFIRPKLRQWRDEHRARVDARRRRATIPFNARRDEDDDDDNNENVGNGDIPGLHPDSDATSSIELRDFNARTSTTVWSPPMSAGLRNRRTHSGAENSAQSDVIDGSIADIPYEPMAPLPVSWRSTASTATPTVSPPQSPFAVGSETTLTSPHMSPQQNVWAVDASPRRSPVTSPRIELPTPPASQSPASPPPILPPLQTPRSLGNLNVIAPSMSMQTSSSSLSFNTALSPQTDFRSFPTSPLSDSQMFSGDEEMFSVGSRSSESLLRFVSARGVGDTASGSERGDPDGHRGLGERGDFTEHGDYDDLSDSLSDGSGEGSSNGSSDDSWQDVMDVRSGVASPR